MYVKHLGQMLGTEQELDKCYILLTIHDYFTNKKYVLLL